MFDKKTLINVKTVILRLEKEALNIKADEKFVLESFTEEFFSLDAKETRRRLVTDFDNPIKRFFSKEYKELIKPLKAMRKTARIPKYDELVELFYSSERRNEAVGVFSEYKKKISESLDEDCISLDTDWKKISDELDGLYDLIDLAKSYFDAISAHVCDFSAFKERLSQYAESLREARRVSGGALKSFAQGFNKNIFDYEAIPVCELNEKISGCLCNLDGFESWCRFLNLKDKLSEADLSLFITKAIDSGVEPSLIVDAYKKSYYRAWADRIIGFSLPLNEFTRISQDKSVETFSKCEEALFRLNREEIAAKLSAKRPNISVISPGSPVAILTREGEKLKRQKSIRTLLSEVGELVQQIKPCFLMSPLSVSTYLSANSNIHFDVVVFDEASQIFPQDAVGAIYRANQMIVVGDSKQMPPSNFFNASSNLDESEDEDEAEDGGCYESILDLCSTSMPQLRLKWHYRSRYEQLIEFSNKNFYDGDLITFPSAITDRAWVGVDYYYVDGVFERSKRTNREEAEFIVDLIYKNIATYPERSLGVVAFSISQQELIDKLLSKRRIRRPECEFFFRPDRPEPFFIKNLETVQGDERDTIIFSVAYGKDERGVVLHNFGPLNRAGGERRLNVAVTRAKKNVQLVSSMHHTDIDLSRAKSMGAKLLKEYLEFAERKSESVRAKGEGVSEKISLENEVADFLKENGYVADRDVGCSKFKIDVAVKRDTEEDYVVAVECDGEYYRSSGGTRDRDRLRSSVLKDMGWYVYRIWSTEWYKNPAAEKKRLLLAVEEAFAEKTAHPVTPEEKDKREILDKKGYSDPKESCDSFDGHEKKELSENGFPYYEYSDPDEEAKKCPDDFPRLVQAILEKEAPLSEELLIRRMLGVLDEDKVSGVVYTEFGSLMAGCEEYGIERKNGFMYLEERDIVFREVRRGDTPRDISFISTEELSAGIKALSKAAPSMSKARIFNKLNLLCGNLTLTPLAQERLEKIYSELSKA